MLPKFVMTTMLVQETFVMFKLDNVYSKIFLNVQLIDFQQITNASPILVMLDSELFLNQSNVLLEISVPIVSVIHSVDVLQNQKHVKEQVNQDTLSLATQFLEIVKEIFQHVLNQTTQQLLVHKLSLLMVLDVFPDLNALLQTNVPLFSVILVFADSKANHVMMETNAQLIHVISKLETALMSKKFVFLQEEDGFQDVL